MKFEKRSDASASPKETLAEQELTYTPDAVTGEAEEPAPKPVIPPARKKSVFTYIMIMFIAAFLLMALSFFTHQRSNEEAMTQLETSFHATIQDIQENQEKLMALEEQLDAAREAAQEAEEQHRQELAAQQSVIDAKERLVQAMTSLYSLQQTYSARDYEACKALIDAMEAEDIPNLLGSISAEKGVTPPAMRYQQLKEAVEKILTAMEAG